MPSSHPPSMQDVAQAAGVHRTTVSLALRNHPRLPAATRARIRAIADDMGYRINPLVSALMTSRVSRRQPAHQASLAMVSVSPNPPPDLSKSQSSYGQLFRSAQARAEKRGFVFSVFWRYEPGMTTQRFTHILEARNIHGIIIAPHSTPDNRAEIDWKRFSTVELGYNLAAPDFHRVVHDYFHSMRMAFAQCRAHGYRRIGLVLSVPLDAKVHHLWTAAFLHEQQALPRTQRIPPLVPERGQNELRPWIDLHHPEVIISLGSWKPAIEKLGLRLPEDIGFVNLACHHRNGSEAGIFQNWPAMGAAAVDLLISMIQRDERGVPEHAHSLVTSGIWIEGRTLPPRGNASA